ncbi:unnamed protein product [Lactuca virosa]|uniref:Uncharacterized protein n=1 Tax=Lactuca virosa TaxID=75947 RepID=A0AAU9MNP7_9ASTR|nr:unnamed protein product [Lactuca virosa]
MHRQGFYTQRHILETSTSGDFRLNDIDTRNFLPKEPLPYDIVGGLGSYGFTESMEGDGSWRAASSSEEERAVLDDSDPVDTLEMKDNVGMDPDYTSVEHPSKLDLSPDYTPVGVRASQFQVRARRGRGGHFHLTRILTTLPHSFT